MKALLLCLCACLCLFSCKKEDSDGILIRVRNASQYPLENIVVSPQHNYGTLGIGQTSDYQSYTGASYSPSVTLTAQGEDLGQININDMPAAGLKPGRYTYVLDVIKGPNGKNRLTDSLEKP